MQRHRKLALALGTAGFILAPTVASAQNEIPLTVSPSGAAPAQPAQPAPATGASYAQPAASAAAEGGEGGEGVEELGYYHADDYDDYVDERETLGATGPASGVPELHVVRTGDTLWDICSYYFNNPWEWPKVWSFNPSITNPHWIYPGDVVRLQLAGAQAAAASDGDEPTPTAIAARAPTSAPIDGVRLRQLAFLADEDMKSSFTIAGAEEERTMLSQNDVLYLEYEEGKPPQVGRRYAIYSPTTQVVHPGPKDKGKVVGAYVRVLGEIEVLSVKKDKRARAIVREATDVIERGNRVGPVQRTYQTVADTPNSSDAVGTIVAQLSSSELIGAHQLVILDLGEAAGVATGNRMYIVRRGDAKPEMLDRRVGDDDDRFPAYAIGEALVVQVGKSTSVGLVTLSVQEFEIGDHVLMRSGR